MKNTLVSFQDKYFAYKGAVKGDNFTNEDVALAIGGYKSAFLANLVALYLFEMTGSKFIKAKYKGIYRGNGGGYLQFTTEIWNPTTEVKLTMEEEKEWTGINKETKKKEERPAVEICGSKEHSQALDL
eukprot:15365943-Ditylum_brightwellii.AAC.1